MSQQKTPAGFDEQNAATYDDRYAPIAAIRDTLHLRAILSPLPDMEALITAAGFERPTLFHQALLIRAWFTQRRPG